MISPPLAVNETANGCDPRLPSARLGYFNLHGLSDSPEWYGQRDPVDGSTEGPDYPVALRPQDVGIGERTNNCGAPHVIFTEACYGMHIQGKAIDEALALKFLASGSQAIAGSTSMAYGSISTPLIAADLLGHAFWDFVRAGLPAGEALRRAKIHLAREMHNRQGYLDGEDQKTLISFVLYGDPLAQPLGSQTGAKSILRPLKPPAAVKTVCDRVTELDGGRPVPSEVMGYVKHVVSQYLPGMDGATITFTEERSQCAAHGHVCPTSQLRHKRLPNGHPARSLVTLSKEFQRSQHTHTQVARLTLDPQGKLVKLVISR